MGDESPGFINCNLMGTSYEISIKHFNKTNPTPPSFISLFAHVDNYQYLPTSIDQKTKTCPNSSPWSPPEL